MSDCLIQRFPASIERLASVIFWIIGRFHAVVTNIGVQPTGQITEHAAVGQKAAQLLDKYGNSILRLAYSYLHNMSDAEDILQDTLLQYLKQRLFWKMKRMKRHGFCGLRRIYRKSRN